MGLIQIDSVNVLVRSQELPLYARLGAHPRTLIPDASGDGELFEYWVHEASHVPIELHPYLRWHMDRDHRWGGVNRLFEARPRFIDDVLDRIERDGPIVAGDLKQRQGPKGTWWDWDDGKIALEYLFHRGLVAAVRRPNDFARVYDLAERVLPADVLATPAVPETDARKELLVRAARHHGVGTVEDLTDYHRQRNPPCRPLIPELVEDGRLVEVTVEGWAKPAYMHPDAVLPRRVEATALLSPFDPVVWNRDRTERLFDFRYRIEIYVPKAKRQFGYYVLPVLIGDRLVGRVDLKADRADGVLRVLALFVEEHAERREVREAIEPELTAMADWLGLANGVAM
ncbi:MAG: crosslink repair DNA glycosylase YcaQ family protein [Actinomycetota bacterium]